MKSFSAELRKPKLSLVYSLPENKVELAEAALAAGADVIKVHINVHHHASGTNFGTLDENKEILKDILSLAQERCVGIVPGGDRVVQPEEIIPLRDMGFSFVSMYAHDCAPEVLNVPGIEKMVAPNYMYSTKELTHWAQWGVDVIETSIIEPDGYGAPLNLRDLGHYTELTQFKLPLLVPTQRKLTPTNIPSLIKIGMQGIMLGAVVTGNEPELIYKIITEFRQAIDKETRPNV